MVLKSNYKETGLLFLRGLSTLVIMTAVLVALIFLLSLDPRTQVAKELAEELKPACEQLAAKRNAHCDAVMVYVSVKR